MPAPELSLSLRPEQRMLLLPKMLQALDVLQLSRTALDDMVSAALAENEALHVRQDSFEEDAGGARAKWKERRVRRETRGRQARRLEDLAGAGPSLKDHLLAQIAGIDAPPRILALLAYLAESLDGAGLRTLTDREWSFGVDPPASAAELGLCEEEFLRLEPRGAGARDAVSAMLCQVSDADADKPVIERILRGHLDDLARHRRGAVARSLAIELEELELLLTKIAALNPRPSRGFSGGAAPVVRPEVRVRRRGPGLEILHVESDAFALEIDPAVAAAARDRSTPPELRAHLRERLDSARELLQCLGQRRQTLERVVHALFLRQAAFLDHGPRHLRPLRMQELAESLDIHASTISRAVAGKYVETDWGIFRLRDFFEAGVPTTSGEGATRAGLREAIRECFASEDPCQVLDDGDVVRMLRAKGYVIARRTVAKYRVELGIPSSWHRARARSAPAAVMA